MTSYVILFMYDVTKSLKMRKWRHISSHVHLIKKCPVITFFSIKFPIEWAIWQPSTIILKFFEKMFFNGEEFSKIEGQFAKFQPIFILKTVLNSQEIGKSSFEQSTELETPYFFTILSLPTLIKVLHKLFNFLQWI